jgi:hypothetical protein
MPKAAYPRLASLFDLSGGSLHEGNLNKFFCGLVLQVSHDLVFSATLATWLQPLPATGVRPFFELIIDGGTIGKYYSRSRDSVLLVAVIFSCPYPPYTRVELLDIINEGQDGSRAASILKLKAMVASFNIPWGDFIATLAAACGDGVYAGGGADARHRGPRCFEAADFWGGDSAPQRTLWDFFHCLDKALARAVAGSKRAVALNNLLRKLEHVFGMGQGRSIEHGTAEYLGTRVLSFKTPVRTRKGTSLLHCVSRYLGKFQNLYYAMKLRQRHVIVFGRSARSIEQMNAAADPLCDAAMITFALSMPACNENTLSPFAARLQNVCDLPWKRWTARCQALRAIETHKQALSRVRLLMRIYIMVSPLVGNPLSMRRFWLAQCLSQALHPLYHETFYLPAQIFEVFTAGVFHGCDLTIVLPAAGGNIQLLAPWCQCCTAPRRQPGTVGLRRGGGLLSAPSTLQVESHGRKFSVPQWVAHDILRRILAHVCTDEQRGQCAASLAEVFGSNRGLSKSRVQSASHRG